MILIRGHSCNGSIMFYTGRVEYDGHIVLVTVVGISIGVVVGRRLLTVYVVAPTSPVIIIIIIIIIIVVLSRDVVIVRLAIFPPGIG